MPTFLICEDSPLIRLFVRRTFEGAFPGSEILEAGDGKQGLSMMKSHRIDLIVTDLQMEGMDGDSFLHLLKRNNVLAKKPVLVLSGMISDQLRQEFAGRDDVKFLPKPASAENLIESAQTLMGVLR
jgi:two-component system chemotaxis response regulator CheY